MATNKPSQTPDGWFPEPVYMPDTQHVQDQSLEHDSSENFTTSSSWETAAELTYFDGSLWGKARPLTIAGSEPHEARLLQKTTSEISVPNPGLTVDDDPFYNLVAEAVGSTSGLRSDPEVAAGDYWPKYTEPYEVDTTTLLLQVREGSTATPADTDNYLDADRK